MASRPLQAEPLTIAALLYTSGTTGFPKGALLVAPGDDDGCARCRRTPGLRGGRPLDLDHSAVSLRRLHSQSSGLPADGCGLCGRAEFRSGGHVPASSRDERCTFLSGVPTSYLAMLDHPARKNYDLSSLRAGTCGGADCNPDVLRRCAEEFPMPGLAQVYGQTEGATLFVCPYGG